jgi:ATPase family associated with various cellular activities (AAA)
MTVHPSHDVLASHGVQGLELDRMRARYLLRLAVQRRLEASEETVATSTERVDDHEYDTKSPIGELVRTLDISRTKSDVIALLFACETDPESARLAACLTEKSGAPLTLALLFEIVYETRAGLDGEAVAMMHRDLAPESGARRLRFLLVDGVETRTLLAQTVRLHPRLTAWLLGRRTLDAEISACARLHAPVALEGAVAPDLLAEVIATYTEGERLLVMHGSAGSGRELALRLAAYQLGRPLLLVRGRDLPHDRIVAIFREAVLHGAMIAITDAEEMLRGEGLARFRDCLDAYPETVACTGLGTATQLLHTARPIIEIELAVPAHQGRMQLWRTHLTGSVEISDAQWFEIAGLYNLGVGGIIEACEGARAVARRRGSPVQRRDISVSIRRRFDTDLAAVAKRVEVTQTWEDLVLAPDVLDSVVGVVDRVAYRNEVLGDWGFRRKIGKGLGITVLFSGPPGTGKSMVAGLIARELGLDLYVVDLSRITSKWLGETEKNLARAFDAAEAGHALLLFDEADSVLGRRTTDVRSSNDRNANLETNFILARLEQFQGLAAFTTNLASAIDPAVVRRMSANIVFPPPDVEARTELWRRMIPAEAPIDGVIDFASLARSYELSGGFIRNVVLRAAYLAAREGRGLSTALLDHAARGEYGDRGALTVGGRLA